MPQSLAQKLRIKPGQRVAVLNAPESEDELLRAFPDGVSVIDDPEGSFDQVHLFVRNRAELSRLASRAVTALESQGLLWVYFPKKASEAQTDLTRDRGWEPLNSAGFSGISLISLDEIWSAFAFRRRAHHRKPAAGRTAAKATGSAAHLNRGKRVVKAPPDLQSGFRKNPRAAAAFRALSFTHRKEYVAWILQARKEMTRARRVASAIKLLAAGVPHPHAK
jgi:hypothetical protein